MPDARTKKKELTYRLFGRSTIDYSQGCGKPISEAISAISFVDESSTELENIPIFVIALAAFSLFAFIVFSINCNNSGTDNYIICASQVQSVFLVFSLVVLIVTAVDSSRWNKKFTSLQTWNQFSDCLTDEYTKVSEDVVEEYEIAQSSAAKSLWVAIIGVIISITFQTLQCIASKHIDSD